MSSRNVAKKTVQRSKGPPASDEETITEDTAKRPLSAALFGKVVAGLSVPFLGALSALYLQASGISVSVARTETNVTNLLDRAKDLDAKIVEATKTIAETNKQIAVLDTKVAAADTKIGTLDAKVAAIPSAPARGPGH